MSLFQKSVEKKYLNDLDSVLIAKNMLIFKTILAIQKFRKIYEMQKKNNFKRDF